MLQLLLQSKNALLLKVLFTVEKSVLKQHQPTHSMSTNYINFMFKVLNFVYILGTINYNTSTQLVYVYSKHTSLNKQKKNHWPQQ